MNQQQIDAFSVDQLLVVGAGLDALPAAARLADKRFLPLAYIREGGAKDHGTRRQIEGRPEAHRGGKVILVIGHDMEMAEAEAALSVYEMEIVEVIYASFRDEYSPAIG